MGHPRGQSQGHKNPQGRLHPPFPELTNFDRVYFDQLPDGDITYTYGEASNRKRQQSKISGFLQLTVLCSKTKQVETYPRSEYTEQIF